MAGGESWRVRGWGRWEGLGRVRLGPAGFGWAGFGRCRLTRPVRPQPPRPCEDYWWEWRHCRGLRHAFHHYYAHGQLPACARWRDDYTACRAWESGRAAAAQVPPGGGARGLAPGCGAKGLEPPFGLSPR